MPGETFGADDLTALTQSIFREAFQAARMFPHITWEQAYESFEEYSRQQEGKPFGTHTPEG